MDIMFGVFATGSFSSWGVSSKLNIKTCPNWGFDRPMGKATSKSGQTNLAVFMKTQWSIVE